MTARARLLISALVAFGFYFAWAYWANSATDIPLDVTIRVALAGTRIPGAWVAPLIPLAVQTCLVVLVNVLNQTPNLWLTVAPSIFFTGLYGYLYTFTLLNKGKQQNTDTL